MSGVGEVQDWVFLAGRDGDEHIAVVQFLLQQSDVLPVNAVTRSWDHLMFDIERATDRSVIMLGSNVRSSEIEDIKNSVAMLCGTIPEIVIRSDSDDSKVIIFRAVRSF